ncbi:MAG: pentapeptide repeat-containing protein [Microcoleaceae cyanobacterium]
MKTLYKVVLAAVVPVLLGSTPAVAENPADLKKLLETGACAGCNLSGADLRDTHLIGADLRGANLFGADLENANLEGADLKGANLTAANLTGAFLNSAELENVNLSQANLTDANLIQARLTDTNLAGANLTGTSLIARSTEGVQRLPQGSARGLTDTELSIGRDPDKATFPLGGAEFEGDFEYTQEYLDAFFRPIRVNSGESSSPGGFPQIRF